MSFKNKDSPVYSSYYTGPPPKSSRSCKSKFLGIPFWLWSILVLIVIIVIVVPIAVMFGKKKSGAPKSEVLVPLYVYPAPGAWDPLYAAAKKYPDLNFTAVVNPASGPGSQPLPDGNYTREISRLNTYANIRTVGYVSTSWTNRNISLALQDIEVYSQWATNSTVDNLGMKGIFLDEAPTAWTAEAETYLETLAQRIRGDTAGFTANSWIIHNPGAIPDSRFLSSCNLSVVFEGTYDTYQIYGVHKTISAFRSSADTDRAALAAVVHSIPATLSTKGEEKLVNDLRQVAGSVFLTGLDVDYYSTFWSGWTVWVGGMNKK